MIRALPTILALCLLPRLALALEEDAPKALDGVTIDDKRGAQIDLDLPFTDHAGRAVHLRDYFGDDKPVLLTLNYYGCKMLCSLQLNGVADVLRALEWRPGEQFRVVTVSIDPREGHDLARGKRESYLEALDRGDVDWTFLVGSEESIRSLADAVGFRFRYDKETDQYAHSAGMFFLSPAGKLMQVLFGVKYNPRDTKFALIEAGEGKVGSTFERLILSCFHYDDLTGSYTPFAMGIMRLGGAATAIGIALLLTLLWRRERQRRRAEQMT